MVVSGLPPGNATLKPTRVKLRRGLDGSSIPVGIGSPIHPVVPSSLSLDAGNA